MSIPQVHPPSPSRHPQTNPFLVSTVTDLLEYVEKRLGSFTSTFAEWFLSGNQVKSIAFASQSKLLLVYFYSTIKRKSLVTSLADCGQDVLQSADKRRIGLLICTEDLVDMSGDELIDRMRKKDPETRCILVVQDATLDKNPYRIYNAPVVVASKDIGTKEIPLRQALLAAIGQTTYRSPSILPANTDNISKLDVELSDREAQLLSCYAQGLNLRESASSMGCTYQSAKTYSRDLLQKLKVGNRQLAIRRGIELGLTGRIGSSSIDR
jgi:DNA-binding NarL/FixJ family response regulator